MRIIRQASYAAVPWKNGGGVTHEAIRVPPEGDAFRWRVSLARIDSSGPFSDFSAYRRFMVLLQGSGVMLEFKSPSDAAGPQQGWRRELLRIGDMEEFDGGLATHCDLVDGPCVDLNLMVSKQESDVRARVEPLAEPLSAALSRAVSLLVIPIDAAVEVRCAAETCMLERWDLALVSGIDDPKVRIAEIGRLAAAGAAKIFLAELPTGGP